MLVYPPSVCVYLQTGQHVVLRHF